MKSNYGSISLFEYKGVVKIVNSGIINVKDFGAKGDGVTDDTQAIQTTLNYASTNSIQVHIPQGTYLISSTISIPNNVNVIGIGNASEIKASAAITMLRLSSTSNYGNRYGVLSNLKINGNNIATIGLDLAHVIVKRSFSNLQIDFINGTGLQMDSTQNCTFDSVHFESCVIGIRLLNGAGNNKFIRCEINASASYGLVFDVDTTLPGYNNNAFNNTSQGNDFDKCIIERGNGIYGVFIKVGKRNLLKHCDITTGSAAKVFIGPDSRNALNRLEYCTLISTAPLFVDNGGFRTFLLECIMEGYTSTTADAIWSTNSIIIDQCHFGSNSYKIVNKLGDQKINIKFIPIISSGSTANRPAMGHMGVVEYFDTTLNKPIWWNTANWTDSLGSIV